MAVAVPHVEKVNETKALSPGCGLVTRKFTSPEGLPLKLRTALFVPRTVAPHAMAVKAHAPLLGAGVGALVGRNVGRGIGLVVGLSVGVGVGFETGWYVGAALGSSVGL